MIYTVKPLEIVLKRFDYGELDTVGVLKIPGGKFKLFTLERAWHDNKPFESCIPTGYYICRRVKSRRWHETFELNNVPGRTLIQFHPGNTYKDSSGCILLGEWFSRFGATRALLDSRDAFNRFMKFLDGIDNFRLRIVEENYAYW